MIRTATLCAALLILAGSVRSAPASPDLVDVEFSSSIATPPAAWVDDVPEGFVDEMVFAPKWNTTGFLVLGENDFITWRKKGRVERWLNGVYLSPPIVDISEEVGNWNEHGLHGFVRDPNFDLNGYVYLYYVVDRYYLDNFGMPGYDPELSLDYVETIARITRYSVIDPSDPSSPVDPASRLILVGETIADGIPICGGSHGIGTLTFGEDDSLLFGTGDSFYGGAVPQANCLAAGILTPNTMIDNYRSQYLESPNGKILRIDPATGEGHSDNPFYDSMNPSSWTSRVWALGLRNPYRFSIRVDSETSRLQSGPGTIYVGDVGGNKWEELNVITGGGQDMGWPMWEGMEVSTYWLARTFPNPDAPNPLFGMPGCTQPNFTFDKLVIEDTLGALSWPNPCDPAQEIPTTIPLFVHTRPRVAWTHRDRGPTPMTMVPDYDAMGNAISLDIDDPSSSVAGTPYFGNCSIGGFWYTGTRFPAPFDTAFYSGDYAENWIKAFVFDDDHELVEVVDFASATDGVTFMAPGADGDSVYYLSYNPPEIHRIHYTDNARPVASATATPIFGPAPLSVRFDAGASVDPDGDALTYAWDFGDGERWTPIHTWVDPIYIYGSEDVTDLAQAITGGGTLSPPATTTGSGGGKRSRRLSVRGLYHFSRRSARRSVRPAWLIDRRPDGRRGSVPLDRVSPAGRARVPRSRLSRGVQLRIFRCATLIADRRDMGRDEQAVGARLRFADRSRATW